MDLKFYDNNGNILPELFDEKAMEIANSFIEKNGRYINGVTKTQLRKLFDEVKRFERKLKINPDSWNEIYPLIRMIKSKSVYLTARAGSRDKGYYKNLNNFIKVGINNVKSEKDYKTFCLLFEAVYGFYYELGVNKK